MSSPIVSTLGTLTSAGVTGFAGGESADNAVFSVTVSSIGTNVVIRLEGSVDATNWFNLDSNNVDTTITATAPLATLWSKCPCLTSVAAW